MAKKTFVVAGPASLTVGDAAQYVLKDQNGKDVPADRFELAAASMAAKVSSQGIVLALAPGQVEVVAFKQGKRWT